MDPQLSEFHFQEVSFHALSFTTQEIFTSERQSI